MDNNIFVLKYEATLTALPAVNLRIRLVLELYVGHMQTSTARPVVSLIMDANTIN